VVAHVVVEQVLALEADGHLRHQAGLALELEGVGEVGVDQGVAPGGRLVGADPVLIEGVQEAEPGEPTGIAVVEAGPGAVRRDARDVAALRVVEAGADAIILGVHPPGAVPDAPDIQLALQLRAVEGRVALPVQDLVQLGAASGRPAGVKRAVALLAGEALEDEAVEPRVVGRGIEPERPLGLPEAELEGACLLLGQERVADLDGAGRVVRALGEQLRVRRRPLHVLPRQPRHHAPRQVVEGAHAAAEGHEPALGGDGRGTVQPGAVDRGPLDAGGGL